MENKIVKLYYAVVINDDMRFFRYGLDYVPYNEENCSCLLADYSDFETAFKCAPEVLPDFIHAGKTIFHKDCLIIDRNLNYDDSKITARNFKPMKIYKVYKLVSPDFYTLDYLRKELPAEKMVQFLLENIKKP